MPRVEGSPGGTGKAVAMRVHTSEQGGEAVGALGDAPREGATDQPAEKTVGSLPQLRSHPPEAGGAPGQQETSRWDCPEKAAPQLGLVSWASNQTWGGKEREEDWERGRGRVMGGKREGGLCVCLDGTRVWRLYKVEVRQSPLFRIALSS